MTSWSSTWLSHFKMFSYLFFPFSYYENGFSFYFLLLTDQERAGPWEAKQAAAQPPTHHLFTKPSITPNPSLQFIRNFPPTPPIKRLFEPHFMGKMNFGIVY